jgi:hypothetical protein
VKHWGGIHLFGEMYGPIRRGCCTSCVYNAEAHAAGFFLLVFIRFRTPSSAPVYAPFFRLNIISLLLHLIFRFPSTSSSTSSSCTSYSLPSSYPLPSVAYGLERTDLFRIRQNFWSVSLHSPIYTHSCVPDEVVGYCTCYVQKFVTKMRRDSTVGMKAEYGLQAEGSEFESR